MNTTTRFPVASLMKIVVHQLSRERRPQSDPAGLCFCASFVFHTVRVFAGENNRYHIVNKNIAIKILSQTESSLDVVREPTRLSE